MTVAYIREVSLKPSIETNIDLIVGYDLELNGTHANTNRKSRSPTKNPASDSTTEATM
jgi:hypothetical protein